ncbi:MAG TPA: hypothetical protein VN428_07230, partial [Bryobacteraceae bacterium]|nr:hypothetical protein [Bryobacteraceae bacterium]
MALHLGMMLLLPAVAARIVPTQEEVAASRNERLMRTLRIRIPEQLYLAASGPAVERRKPVIVFKAEPPRPAAAPRSAATRSNSASARRAFRRRLELPPVPKRIITDQILIQPRSPAEMLPSAGLQLPELFFWAPPPPRQPVRPFVRPGHRSPPQARMRLDAPPRIETPGPDPAALKLAAAPATGALTYAPAPSMPVRTTVSENPQPAAPVADTVPGDPANVLALSTRSLPLREFVTVPPGNQVSETPAGQAGSALSGTPGNGAPGANAGDSGAGSASSQASASSSEAARNADAAMPDSPAAAKPQAPVRAVAAAAAPLSAPAPVETPLTASAILKATIEA